MGWLTGGVMAATLYFGSMALPYTVAVMLAIAVRLLLTGALHEDGLADFFDGFGGGGNDRQRILDIMKDSHIGTYGVLGLVLYLALLAGALLSLSPEMAALVILAADPYAKMVAAQLIQMMPYARKEEHQSRLSRSATHGCIPMADRHRLGDGDLPALSGDVFPLPADVAQDSRLYG